MEKTIKESYTRDEVIKLLERIAFYYSDNGDTNTNPHVWLNRMEGVDDGYIAEAEEEEEEY